MLVWLTGAMLAGAVPDAPQLPAWMAGCWIEEKGDRWTEECWTDAKGGMMLGSGRSGRGTKAGSWETMQLLPAANGALAYWGSPRGENRTAFNLVTHTGSEIVFSNPAHDYPQRIRYWRDGALLNAETAMADGSRAMRWSYRRR